MKAMVLFKVCSIADNQQPLSMVMLPDPVPGEKELLVKVSTCGVCHTELDEIEGRTPPPHLPIILGHQVIGRVEKLGARATRFNRGDRVGIAWIHSSCGCCEHCVGGYENLCAHFTATGRDVNGGYAEYMTVPEDFAYLVPAFFSDLEAAPLLCAGAIGYRSLRLSGIQNGQLLGLTGFGASAHLVIKMVKHLYPDTGVFVFARSRDEQQFARELGAAWAGDTEAQPPEHLHCIIDTTPAWTPVLTALRNLVPGGRLVINAIRKENADRETLLCLDYASHLWMEKEIKSVANVSRRDVIEFLQLAAEISIRPVVKEFPLEDANNALVQFKQKQIKGAKVLRIEQ